MKQLKKLNRKGAKAAKPFSNRNGRFEKTAIIFSVRSFKTDSIPITVPFSEMPAGPIALPNRPFRFGKKLNLSVLSVLSEAPPAGQVGGKSSC